MIYKGLKPLWANGIGCHLLEGFFPTCLEAYRLTASSTVMGKSYATLIDEFFGALPEGEKKLVNGRTPLQSITHMQKYSL